MSRGSCSTFGRLRCAGSARWERRCVFHGSLDGSPPAVLAALECHVGPYASATFKATVSHAPPVLACSCALSTILRRLAISSLASEASFSAGRPMLRHASCRLRITARMAQVRRRATVCSSARTVFLRRGKWHQPRALAAARLHSCHDLRSRAGSPPTCRTRRQSCRIKRRHKVKRSIRFWLSYARR